MGHVCYYDSMSARGLSSMVESDNRPNHGVWLGLIRQL